MLSTNVTTQQAAVLHPETHMGAVQLTVSNLERSLTFYQEVLGFQRHDRTDGQATLGAGGDDLLHLVELPNARHVSHHSGLYHFAVLTPSRPALGQVLHSLVEHGVQIGGSDHLVSEAIYLNDPDGIGIEVYRDRPRDTWRYENGRVVMGGLPLDYQGILREGMAMGESWSGLEPETVIGHIHLHVGDLPAALKFYQEIIGFDLMATWNGAAFYAAGGYHHHLATNTWAGVGAPPQPADAVGLRHYTVHLADDTERTHLLARLAANGVTYAEQSDGLFARDPAQNGILFVV
ncbi:MAG: VOC family protein [Caldilineaceae bacterium]